MVVEHDVLTLGLPTDVIHVLYGEPGSFDIVSHRLGVRVGIDQFLEGRLQQENVIVFEGISGEYGRASAPRATRMAWTNTSLRSGSRFGVTSEPVGHRSITPRAGSTVNRSGVASTVSPSNVPPSRTQDSRTPDQSSRLESQSRNQHQHQNCQTSVVNYPCLLGGLRRLLEAGASCFDDATCRHGKRVRSGRSLRRRVFGVNHS